MSGSFVVGLDVGYGNLKVAFGQANARPQTHIRPVGAAPKAALGMEMGGSEVDGLSVLVDGEPWVAGVDPFALGTAFQRKLHQDYPATAQYRALFHAALVMTNRRVVDLLVVGLPVSQFLESGQRERLAERLRGEHTVSDTRKVTVRDVLVVPQPMGAYLDYLYYTGTDARHMGVLVLDPGQYSVDWVVVTAGTIQKASSSSSKMAMSVVLEKAVEDVQGRLGVKVSPDRIERAVREGCSEVVIGKHKEDLGALMQKASNAVCVPVVEQVLSKMRQSDDMVDVVILAGGGAQAYRAVVDRFFPESVVAISDDALFANARGFFHYGSIEASKQAAS